MKTGENGRKHLEFIQDIITRMGSNSFLIKGWTITLVSALFALAAKDANLNYVFITYIAIPTFWGLDAYYLSKERKYRGLYNHVASTKEDDIDFSLKAKGDEDFYSDEDKITNKWTSSLLSVAIWPLYSTIILITLCVMFLFKTFGKG